MSGPERYGKPAASDTSSHRVLGRGRLSQGLAWEEGWVLKLFDPRVSRDEVEREFLATQLAHRLGAPVPAVREIIEYQGRLGMVCQKLPGVTLLQRPWALVCSGGRLAELHARLHRLSGSGLMAQKDRLRRQILQAPLLSQRTRRAALGILEELPGGECLCHGDFHPGNVMLDGSRELVIDWHDASCGNPAADVARTWLLLRTALWSHRMTRRIVVGLAGRWLFHGYFNRYQELVPGMREEFHRWRLPVVAARLSEGVAGVEGRLVRLADELAKPVG